MNDSREVRWRLCLAAVSALLIAAPFFSVHFAPLLDAPPQMAQMRLFFAYWSDPELQAVYRVQLLSPYLLSYLILGLNYLLFDPVTAGRMAMLVIGLMWVAAIHGLAARLGRSPALATLACVFFFNHFVYWGFYSFAVGLPVFLAFFYLSACVPLQDRRLSHSIGLGLAAFLLYYSHAMWAFGAGFWYFCVLVVLRRPPRIADLIALSPTGVLSLAWVRGHSSGGEGLELEWTPWLFKLSPEWWVLAALGGLTGPAEWLLLGFAAALCAALASRAFAGASGQADSGSQPEAGFAIVERRLLVAAGALLLLALFLPEKGRATIKGDTRWVPVIWVLLLLAFSDASYERYLRMVLPVVLAVVVGYSATVWRTMEREEFSGLERTIEATPDGARVIGLNFAPSTHIRQGRSIFVQMHFYARAFKSVDLQNAFAEFPQVLVTLREPPDYGWTRGLEHDPNFVRAQDLMFFSHVLVNGDKKIHLYFEERPYLEARTTGGRWRLYERVGPPQPGNCMGQPGNMAPPGAAPRVWGYGDVCF